MGLSRTELNRIEKEFTNQYDGYGYVNGCAIDSLRAQQGVQKERLSLGDGESLDDLCLSVMLSSKPPENLQFPSRYKGVRVFYSLVGEITAW